MIEEVGEDMFTANKVTQVLSIPGFKSGMNHRYDALNQTTFKKAV
jgi:hypothetical protein